MEESYLKNYRKGRTILLVVNLTTAFVFFIAYLFIWNAWLITASTAFILASFVLLYVLNHYEEKLKNLENDDKKVI